MASMPAGRRRLGLVLAGGAARGAYEAGVVQYLCEELPKSLGHELPIDVLAGTSVGALNACLLAAFADEPRQRARLLVEHWTSLEVQSIVRFDRGGMTSMIRGLLGRPSPVKLLDDRRGGLLDPVGIEALVHRAVPFPRIAANLKTGHLTGLTVSATHVGTGRTVVFVGCEGPLPRWGSDPTVVPVKTTMTAEHALASAAIPMLFPAVRVQGDFYCDGGLRQNVPLSPARRMGADGLIIVSPRFLSEAEEGGRWQPSQEESKRHEAAYPGLFFLLGKALNALLLDRIDADLDRLRRINEILEAGTRRWGPSFVQELNQAMGRTPDDPIRPLETVLVRASQDIGRLTAEFVRSPAFSDRVDGVLGYFMQRLADGDAENEADLLSYLLFDGVFARQLIELGWKDASQKHEELCHLVHALCGEDHEHDDGHEGRRAGGRG